MTLNRNRGFTLIELLVTIALIVVLLSIAIAVSSSATLDSYKIVGAGDKLSQALITSKSRAARDKAPRGVRLIVDAQGHSNELIYIEQPEPWIPDQSQTLGGTTPNAGMRSYLAIRYPDPDPSVTTTAPANYAFPKPQPNQCRLFLVLTPNDDVRFQAMFVSGVTHIVSSPDITAAFAFSTAGVLPPTALANVPAGYVVRLLNVASIINPDLGAGYTPAATASMATFQTTNFGIFPPPKPLAGEPTIILSKDVVVDLNASLPGLLGATPQNVDFLFSPSGHLMYRNDPLIGLVLRNTKKLPAPTPSGTPTTYTWLNDPTVGTPNFKLTGEMTIVAIYPKTGTVFTKPVADPASNGNDPFAYCRDAIGNSGL